MPHKDPEARRAYSLRKYHERKAERKAKGLPDPTIEYRKTDQYRKTLRAWREKNRQAIRLRKRKWYAKQKIENPEKFRQVNRREVLARYALTPAEFEKMMADQGGGCAICLADLSALPPKKRHVDHDHSTKIVRGILCAKCNHVLGFARDDVEVLRAAIEYILKWRMAAVADPVLQRAIRLIVN